MAAQHVSTHTMLPPNNGEPPAPWLSIPSRAISSVEHPCIIKNIDKAITSLGGPVKLSKALVSAPKLSPQGRTLGDLVDPDPTGLVSLSLRPDDPFAKRLLSTPVDTSNLLLKVTVPKRTGRKRRRGSSNPFIAGDDPDTRKRQDERIPASSLFRRLQDNASKYTVSVVGMIDETHRFRDLPDLQYAASTNSIFANLKDSILPTKYDLLSNFEVNMEAGADFSKNVGPSAEFLQTPVAYNYRFKQNTSIRYTGETRTEINSHSRLTFAACSIVKPGATNVPQGPKSELIPEYQLAPYMQSLITAIRLQLEHRPIITRHTLYNKLGWDKREKLRQAALYCGYFFESGPWREALIKWGVDPRKDPVYRKYQTVSFMSYMKNSAGRRLGPQENHIRKLLEKNPKELENQHIFDGKTVSSTGNLFQFCDITDPQIRRVLDTKDIRNTCAPTFQGWYHVGTWAKATVLLRDKMNRIINDEDGPDDSIYERILTWPELWDDQEIYAKYRAEYYDRQTHREKLKEHNVMVNVRWAARNPRYTFEKMEELGREKAVGTEKERDMEEPAENEVPEDMTEEPDTAEAILNEGDENADGEADEDVDDETGEVEGEEDEDEEDDFGDQEREGEGKDREVGVRIGAESDREWELDDEQPRQIIAPRTTTARGAFQGPRAFGGLFPE